MKYITIKPVLGTKNDCPSNDESLYKFLDQYGRQYATHDVGGLNFDFERNKGACNKAYGKAKWSKAATDEATKCLGLGTVYDGTNRDFLVFDNGKVYVYDAAREPTDISGGVTFANDDTDLYSIIQFGGRLIFSDHGEHTPYQWYNGQSAVSKLIKSGTEFKFRYLTHIANHIVGAYTDQTNGDLEIRWTGSLPTWASLSFPAANQIYKPEGDESITGIAKLYNTGFVFSAADITRLDYVSSASTPFSAIRAIKGWGSVNHHSIVSDGVYLYFFDERRGFCRFDGNREPVVISQNIEGTINNLAEGHYPLITAAYLPFTNEIVWNVGYEDYPNRFVFYNRLTGQWRIEDKAARYLSVWKTWEDFTWNDLMALATDTGTWNDVLDSYTWYHYINEVDQLVWANTDGYIYYRASDDDDTSNLDAYRIEPVIIFPGDNDNIYYKRILEIWLDIAEKRDVDVDFYWRGGDSPGEVDNESWTSLGSINMNGSNPVLYIDQVARCHQIKWGTDLKDEPFSINGIRIGYVSAGKY